MSTKRKILGLSATIGASVLAVTGIAIGVLAAQNQNLKNNFSINYEGNNVAAILTANYKTKTGSDTAMVNSANTSSTELVFAPGDSSVTGSLQVGTGDEHTITLTANDNYVIIKNEFKNNNSAGGIYLAVNFQNDYLTSTNCVIKYFPSNYGGVDNNVGIYESYEKIDTYGLAYNSLTQTTYYIAPQDSFYIYTLIEIDEITLDASVATNNAITPFALSTVAQASIPAAWGTYVSANEDHWGVPAVTPASLTAIELNDSNFVVAFDSTKTIEQTNAILSQLDWEHASTLSDEHHAFNGFKYINLIEVTSAPSNTVTRVVVWYGSSEKAIEWGFPAEDSYYVDCGGDVTFYVGGDLMNEQTNYGGWAMYDLYSSQEELLTIEGTVSTISSDHTSAWNGVLLGKVSAQQ